MSPNEDDWIANAVGDARRGKTKAPDEIWTTLESLLETTFSQKPISALELQKIAMDLIAGAKNLEHKLDQQ